MLYQMYETQRALMSPFSEFAAASAKLYSHPLSPFAHLPMSQRWSAGFDLLQAGIEAEVRARAMPPFRDVPIVAAQLGPNSGLVGAACLVWPDQKPRT